MTVIWLIIWLINGTPVVQPWNNWFIALIVCIYIDIVRIFIDFAKR